VDYTVDELISVCIARQVVDGEVLAQGINTPLVMAGFILAKCTHAPNIMFASAIGQGVCQSWGRLSLANVEDFWLGQSLLHVGFVTAAADLLPRFHPKEFFRPAQIDAAGNFNNIAFGDYNHPRMRLPGTGGIPDVTPVSDKVYLYVPRHSPVIFIEKVDYVSGVGHANVLERCTGPRYLVSDLGEFDWHGGHMRLIRHFPGVTPAMIQKKTGFSLEIAPNLQETPPPSVEMLRLLREEIDPLNVRKLETLGGSARKTLLREILGAEGVLSAG
jgi:acyl CoA:acetate/3-ketoacid CoA transferase beta subunit